MGVLIKNTRHHSRGVFTARLMVQAPKMSTNDSHLRVHSYRISRRHHFMPASFGQMGEAS